MVVSFCPLCLVIILQYQRCILIDACDRGTGVGLLKKEQPAGEIVREVREVTKQRIQFLQRTFL